MNELTLIPRGTGVASIPWSVARTEETQCGICWCICAQGIIVHGQLLHLGPDEV
jgi:hypothetical protein